MTDDGILLFNPLPWERSVSGPVPSYVVDPRGVPDDETAGRHFQDRVPERPELPTRDRGDSSPDLMGTDTYLLQPTEVPGYGYTVVPEEDLINPDGWSFDERSTVETDRYEVTFDREIGGISSWYDKELDCEWVDPDAEYPLAGFVHERVADENEAPRQRLFTFEGDDWEEWHASAAGIIDADRGFQPDWHARRSGPEEVRQHRVYDTPLGYDVRQHLDVPHVESDVELRMFFPTGSNEIIVEGSWVMGLETAPEATYLAFPFALDDPVAHLDVGGHAIRPGRDQLEGSVYDYYTVQRWADLSDADRGVTVGTPINPLIQFEDFHFADNQSGFSLDRALLLGWVTNNYWDTNFRAHQPGRVRARYHLSPHDGAFDEPSAHRVGMESEYWSPVVQSLGEGTVSEPPLPTSTSLLDLPEPPVLVLQVRPAREDTGVQHPAFERGYRESPDSDILVFLRNASDNATTATVDSGALRIQAAEKTDIFGNQVIEPLDVTDGTVDTELGSREQTTIRIESGLR